MTDLIGYDSCCGYQPKHASAMIAQRHPWKHTQPAQPRLFYKDPCIAERNQTLFALSQSDHSFSPHSDYASTLAIPRAMGGSDAPYLYDPPSNRNSQITYPYSDFNPRAATQAHYAALTEQSERRKRRAEQNGKPLINFNQHPDSYMIINQPQTNFEPMSPSTKKWIIAIRWVQFVFRVFQEIGALGILVCVICLKMASDGPGWIIRVAPAWDVVITLYAIYHLARSAKGRTPSSSASYHFFALFMDVGLIPFYVFIALYSYQNYDEQVGVDGRWTSLFSTNFATTTVIYTTFIASIVMGGLHLVSSTLDLYLILRFRKIAQLPPDMNPLEDNLTGSTRRRSQRHKYKNSEASVVSSVTEIPEKKAGYLSGSTLSLDSTAKEPEMRSMPFGHSRMESNNSYSPHNPNSARLSRQQYENISLSQGPSARSSRVDITDGQRSRSGSLVDSGKNTSVVDFGEIPALPTMSQAERPYTPPKGSFTAARRNTPDNPRTAPTNAVVKSQQKQGLLNDNWYVLEDEVTADLGTPRRSQQAASTYLSAEPTLPNVELSRKDSFEPQPLKMNPPTPPPVEQYPDPDDFDASYRQHGRYEAAQTGVGRTLTAASQATNTSSVYSESAPSLKSNGRPNNGTPKGKYYGDLASATRGVRGNDQVEARGMPSPQSSRTPSPQKKGGRVISRTGVDIADATFGYGLRGRRDVSNNVLERGNW